MNDSVNKIVSLKITSLLGVLFLILVLPGRSPQAAVTILDGWTNQVNNTASSPQSFTYAVSTGSNRLLVVAITTKYGSTGTQTYSATYGGKPLTMIAQYSAGRDNTWVGYLKEADIAARSGNTIRVTYSGGPSNTKVFVAGYQNVDQSSPITDGNGNGSDSWSNTSVSFGRNITTANGDQLFYVAHSGSSSASHTPPSGYTELLQHTGNGFSVSVGHRNSTSAGSENKTITFSSSGPVSIVVASLNEVASTCTAAAPTVTITPAAQTITVNGGSVGYTVNVKNNDTGSGCSNTTFSLALTDSTGTNFVVPSVLSSSSLSLAPGANNNVTMTVKAKTGVTSGTNATSVTVTATGHANASSTVTTAIQAAVSILDGWTNRINTTGSSPQSFTYTVGAGSNRLLVVAITAEYGSTGTRTYSATYGGKPLTMIAQYNTGRDNTWVGYLKEADIAARSGNTIQVTYNGSPSSTKVFAASYQNVDQSSPITDSNANGNSSASSVSFGRNITIADGDQLFYVANVGSGSATQTPPSGYTELLEHTGNGISVSVGHRNSTLAGSENKTITFSSSSSVSIVVASLNATTTVQVTASTSIWNSTTTPAVITANDSNAVELGVKFRSAANGFITALRFYKSPTNTGTHIGNLWTSTGTLLASVTFANETASGWQEASLQVPVAIRANTTYVASYHTSVGQYSVDNNYFTTSGVNTPPLRALADGEDGPNGVYMYGTGGFPTQSYNSVNYWVDVVYAATVPPNVIAISPANSASGVSIRTNISATFSEAMNPATISVSTFELRNSLSVLVSASVTYDTATKTALLYPAGPLAPGATYTVRVKGGNGGVTDVTGDPLATDYAWSFTTGAPPDTGPGGPVLIIAVPSNPFSRYYAEILRTEGLNSFSVADIASVSAGTLDSYDVVILGEMPLTSSQVAMFSDWVNAGGHLIAMRPDKQLAGLLGITDMGSTLSDAYMLIDTSKGPGFGIVNETIQFHGTADRYSLNNASSIATLYSDATTMASSPAVTLRSEGTNGGQAAAFTYDLARSVVYTRQGNPLWAGQQRDGRTDAIRSDDLFFPDWVDFNKIAIPQADEQQRLLANLIIQMNFNRKPLPRFWYLPRGLPAVVVMTGDDHATMTASGCSDPYGQDPCGGAAGRFDSHIANSSVGCSVPDWECIRSTSYIYPNNPMTNAQAAAYTAAGFEVALHVTTNEADWTPSSLESFFTTQLSQFYSRYYSIPLPVSNRTHWVVWSDYVTEPQVEFNHGIRLDTNYYFFPPTWVNDRPGLFTGSGMPMRFATADGTIIDVYQATTQLTDESGQTYPFTVDTILDKAVGNEGYYGVFVANMHTDDVASSGSDAIIASAKAHGVPVISARQMLEWLDGRNASSFSSLSWTGNALQFTITVADGARNLEAMVPMAVGKTVTSITHNGTPLSYRTGMIKGNQYAIFPAATGAYQVNFTGDSIPPTVSGVSPANGSSDVSVATNVIVTFSEPIDPATITPSTVGLYDSSNTLVSASVNYNSATNTAILTPSSLLLSSASYTVIIKGGVDGVKDVAGNPLASQFASTFITSRPEIAIWDNTTIPTYPSVNDSNAVEVGVRFRSDVNGYITGLRFYKGAGNTGTHIGNLWTNTGTLLASVTFTNETASGWQQANLPTPVAITANTTYVASYHTNVGRYAWDGGYFATSGYYSTPLRALQDGEDGPNGVYLYGAGGFPTLTYSSANYWVDVLFRP